MEDYHLWFKMYAAGYKGYNLKEPIYEMRDDRNAYKRRNWQTYSNLSRLYSVGFRMLRLPFYYQIYVLRPILVWLLPERIYQFLHRR